MAEAALVAAALLVVFGHALWLRWFRHWSAPLLALGRATLVAAVEEPWLQTGEVERLRRDLELVRKLPAELQIQLLIELAPNLSSSHRERLTAIARDSGLIAWAEELCRSRFWWRRLRGVRLLSFLGGGEEVVPALLQDPYVEIRAQAADWCADHPTPAVIQALLALLDDPAGLCRFSVQDALLRMGSRVIEALARYLCEHAGPGLEAGLEIAAGMADSRFVTPALRLCRNDSPRVRALAAGLLGTLGGSEGLGIVIELLADTSAEVRAAAAAALGTLEHWPAAAQVALLLRDPVWTVRQAAGLALRRLGAPGLLLLQGALSDSDRFAADMARQVLDLPDTPTP